MQDEREMAIDGAPSPLTLPTLPLDVLAYLCSFLTTYELAQFMATSTEMASVIMALGVSKPTRDLPTCPTEGPLRGIYVSQYLDANGMPCHRAWRCVHPDTPSTRRRYARLPAPLDQGRVGLPLSVPRGAWCRPRPSLNDLVADLVMGYALVGYGRMRPFLPMAAAILSEPLPPGTLVCAHRSGPHAAATYADVFAHMEKIEHASVKTIGRWPEFGEATRYRGPTNVTARPDPAGGIVLVLGT
ncbi:hypothetical protein pneo_cds_549 [Pandoravirus neocaledonia]|uniref:F-box domain-containing protein n=1 Tax=Pandoravirus neocaledonia TaxID=2107708 RepID=A0A2U7UCJ1_9VIRU|nr:hypothetical protein pneo_cds_549 [Pandoravirus neocaledonia]AVK76156.1 hypothetical protein pneo_cds_549 [Pandoravirus neocaledonia]